MADERSVVLLTDDIRELLALIKESDLAEVLIERGDARVHVKRAVPAPPVVNMVSAPPVQAEQFGPSSLGAPSPMPSARTSDYTPNPGDLVGEERGGVTIMAPMVGTFYATPSPKDPPYVRVGEEVRPGDVVGIIEAMKIMNEIECEVHGRVTRILVENGQPVEYGQALMVIEPSI